MNALAVVHQEVIESSIENCWRCVTTPAMVSEWFADTDLIQQGRRAVFDFGDGDFFAGPIVSLEEPTCLRLYWRFWDLGPSYNITFILSPCGNSTQVSVIDFGSGTPKEVESLREGWEDFLTRLKMRAETGEACRYRWTEYVATSCFAEDTPDLRDRLVDPAWWQAWFPAAVIAVRREGDVYVVDFAEPGWNDILTSARVRFDTHLGRSCLKVVHSGWTNFPFDMQVPNRRQYAGLWRNMLASVESEYGAQDISAGPTTMIAAR